MKRVYVIGTHDTKGEELGYLADLITQQGLSVSRVDVSTQHPADNAEISASDVASFHPAGQAAVLGLSDRGTAVSAMGHALRHFLLSRDDVGAVIGVVGGGGTSIVSTGMRALPYGLPKLIVSTLASGDVSPYVDVSDITFMPSVTDMAGLNGLSRIILHNAAQAISGMAKAPAVQLQGLPSIGLTMFGVTTPSVMALVDRLKDRFDCMVFHATGTGGRTMEKLVDDGLLAGVLDITTTEVCDLLFGGVLAATEDRLGAVARTKLPYVGSVGALDMVNFWAPETVPERYKDRLFYRHNPNVTLMRTTPDECATIGRWIADKLNRCDGEVRFLIPEQGVSALDVDGGAFFDPQADAALFAAIEQTLVQTSKRRLVRLPLHINDPAFAAAAAQAFLEISR